MEFSAAAEYFNNDQVFDAYTDASLFMAHTATHDDHTSSGATSRRRTLIAGVAATAPARRAIRWYDTFWLVGGNNTDGFLGGEVRRNFGLKKSTGLMRASTPGATALATPGTAFHAHKEYYRDMTDQLTSSDTDVMWNVFCPLGEPVAKGTFLTQGSAVFRVRSVYETVDEFLVAESDQFDADARQSAVFTAAPALEFTAGASPGTTTVSVIQTDVSKYYVFRNEAESGSKPGDRTVFVAKSSVTPAVGGHMQMMGASWRIVTVVSEGDAYALRVRQA